MTATQIIEQIRDLGTEDRIAVIEFIKSLESTTPGGVNYADDSAFEQALTRVMEEDDELLKKLAQ